MAQYVQARRRVEWCELSVLRSCFVHGLGPLRLHAVATRGLTMARTAAAPVPAGKPAGGRANAAGQRENRGAAAADQRENRGAAAADQREDRGAAASTRVVPTRAVSLARVAEAREGLRANGRVAPLQTSMAPKRARTQ